MLLRAPALLGEIEDLLASTSAGSRGYSGVLRISAPVSFGETHVKDLLSRFAAQHPGLSIDLRLDDGFVDLARAGIDLASGRLVELLARLPQPPRPLMPSICKAASCRTGSAR